ncbi:NAD-dependent epimerase/dehydratase family protein [Idiomarina abyssalis]|uniref:NAD-dependent epimerase/dehydratase family protein n=1 Tax=Idiomarina abyssalis TaxID=86102 RepID=A0A8I1G773_9GAMM|nr:NAD-dependent epimerase/dehydratase family protein [Idiomarina abyssalis]MBJ7265766.1 NAD-dependent epimerase/dehydratase family protein [Idiomarina abyssalis]MBJ7274019.1 NAD-dependent epimerase/dehydratase family protein [Idiomarina abyssalis]MBJ7314875.1 NAD-dependent epimerase/dehydratase family protein [Idiomarina abyssalis]
MSKLSRVLLTGATGFVGQELAETLVENESIELHTVGRTHDGKADFFHKVKSIDENTNWGAVLPDLEFDAIIHLAARAHVMNDTKVDALSIYRKINVGGTFSLAKRALNMGIKRFIYVSSAKVNGEQSTKKPFRHDDEPQPKDPYGVSKKEAEEILKNLFEGTPTELVIIRPPLVYGPNVKGNFQALLALAGKNLPLPFGSLNNKRSLVALDNLVSLLVKCVQYESELNATFLVSDDYDVSTRELLEVLTLAQGKKPRMWSFPVALMRLGAVLLGKKAIAGRLFGNLQLDISYTKKALNWEPPLSFHQAIKKCINSEVTSGKLKK